MEDSFPNYSSIINGKLSWNQVVINGNIHNKLILQYKSSNDDTCLSIDNDFGEYMLCSTYRKDPLKKEMITYGNTHTVCYRGLKPFSCSSNGDNKNTVMVRRVPISNTSQLIEFTDSHHMTRDDVIRVVIPPRQGFEIMEFSVYSPVSKMISSPINRFQGRLYMNARAYLHGSDVEQHVDLVLEVDQIEVRQKKTGQIDANGKAIFLPYVCQVTVLYFINRNQFDLIKFFSPHTTPMKFNTIYGEAKVATVLESRIDITGHPLLYSSKNQIFMKICANNNPNGNMVQCTSELCKVGGKECYKTEIEVMAAIKSTINYSNGCCCHHGVDRLVLFIDVVSDDDNIYVILPFKEGSDANSMLNNYNFKTLSLSPTTVAIEESLCKLLLKNVSTALCYLHALGISHNDIKLENIVSCARPDAEIQDWLNKLAIVDFGQARRHFKDHATSNYYPLPWFSTPGTPVYYSPETLNSNAPYNGFKVDVFQLGMMLIYFQSSKLYAKFQKNFEEYKTFINNLSAYGAEQFIELFADRFTDPVFKNLVIRMLDPNPITRVSMEEVRDTVII